MDDDATNILIVDDLPEKLLAYRSVLEELGQNLVEASSGAEALKQILRNDFAVILLDVNMPGMDGFETARLIRQRKASAHTPIIFLTAFADELYRTEAYVSGAVDYLPTPIVPEVLRAKVRVFVDLHRLRQQVIRQAEEQAKRAAAEDAARRGEFLAEASRVLSSPLAVEAGSPVETTLRGLVRLATPALADLGLVCLTDDRGGIGTTETAWSDTADDRPAGQMPADETATKSASIVPPPAGSLRPCGPTADAVLRVIRTGRREHLTRVEGPAVATSDGADAACPVPVGSALVLPLVSRGVTLGALLLARRPDGRRFEAQETSLALDLAGRAAIAIDNALLVRDIREADLRKDEFLAMLGHELRNPLAPVRTGLDLLALSGADADIVGPMRRQVEHLVRLVDDLLDVSRITRGRIDLQFATVDVRRIVANAVEMSRPFVESRGHALAVSMPEAPLRVQGDPVRLAQVLMNLLNNAAKYTAPNGAVSLSVEADGDDVVFRVIDTGDGIPSELLAKIFDLFVQSDRSLDRAEGGLGIGLTIVRRLVEMHDGTVEARSEGPGFGSEFVVRIPAYVAAQGETDGPVAETPAADAPVVALKVLVVDDNVDAAATLGMLLRLNGYDVRLSHDGPAALEAALAFLPDVVLLDIGLPGLDGYEVAQRLRTQAGNEDALLVALSGYGQDEDRRRSRATGFQHHLTKPVDFREIQHVLAQASARTEVRVEG